MKLRASITAAAASAVACLALAPGASAALTKGASGPGGPIQGGIETTVSFTVSGFPGKVTDVNAAIGGISHTYPEDIEVQLVAPSGAAVNLISDAADGTDVSGVSLTFDDAAPGKLPFTNGMGAGPMTSGTFQPSSYDYTGGPPDLDPFGAGTATTLAGLNGGSANGVWKLRVGDDFTAEDNGSFTTSGLTLTSDFKPKKKCKKKKGKKGAAAAKKKKCGKKKKHIVFSAR
jgi:subtilisin-like proprotein convertase family protein